MRTTSARMMKPYYHAAVGSVTAILCKLGRLIRQMKQPDGSAAKGAKDEHVAETAPGRSTFHDKPAYRLRAAVVETPNGSYFVKLVGPEKTVTQWNDSFLSYVRSFEFK